MTPPTTTVSVNNFLNNQASLDAQGLESLVSTISELPISPFVHPRIPRPNSLTSTT